MKVGRPPYYNTVEEMQIDVDKFFTKAPIGELTITGLALALGFTTRQALINYEEKPEFVDAIKTAKLKIENDYELSLRKNGRSGDIFGLKNFGWDDKSSLNIGGQADGVPIQTESKFTPDEAYKNILG